MNVNKEDIAGGRLQVTPSVISGITKVSTLEVEEVSEVSRGNFGVKNLLNSFTATAPIEVELKDGVAYIDVYVILKPDAKVKPTAQKVQDSVKSAVQNMTGITVSKVNVIITGVELSDVVGK